MDLHSNGHVMHSLQFYLQALCSPVTNKVQPLRTQIPLSTLLLVNFIHIFQMVHLMSCTNVASTTAITRADLA
jgi:hypothetical protein